MSQQSDPDYWDDCPETGELEAMEERGRRLLYGEPVRDEDWIAWWTKRTGGEEIVYP